MDIKQIAKDTTKTLVSYLTYQALRTVLAQLDETDPREKRFKMARLISRLFFKRSRI
jgi:hypothetical protein